MTSQPTNISRSKENQTMRFGQVIEYTVRNILLQKSCRKWGKKNSSNPVFQKVLYEVKASAFTCLQFQYISIALDLDTTKNNLCKTLDYWFRDMLSFDFLEKGLARTSPPQFVYNFWRKIFILLYFINLPNFVVWLPWTLEILDNSVL